MASSNRHWPSMFKSKPANCSTHHQWQHDINPSLVSNGCHRPSYSSVAGCEERSPEPKPRWNPKPEQIRILEAIFNSGMVNPPRDEIRKIRAQLQEYGQVGDANVFYWFQNRKSRSKHKLRHLHNSSKQQTHHHTHLPLTTPVSTSTLNIINAAAPSSSSSSSEKSSPKSAPNNKAFSMGFSSNVAAHDVSINSPTASVNQQSSFFQPHHQHHSELLPEPFFFPMHPNPNCNFTQGFCFSELSNVVDVPNHGTHEQTNTNTGPCTSLLLSEIMSHGAAMSRKEYHQEDEMKDMNMKNIDPHHLNYSLNVTTTSPTSHTNMVASHTNGPTTSVAVPSPMIHNIQGGVGEAGAMDAGGAEKSTVFINDVAFEVGAGPFNVREAFGDDAVLIHSSGHPVLTNEWGLTLHSLHHGAFYYLVINFN
ncbi:WUSCHEL-related homeobox 9 isoform X1 [Prunus persica]|uniref:WUSCHEL-related homeobox 9 isoform X1 n=1 Tax=Prunus persica TaxID=3760 RepID=UPI0002C2AC6B|nr:WUSCHEL-related homeobox 9 isoform X1 [Prunus persica]XP_020418315.1 WUSCHEL-related homeobox 9 isoform X1 [Prunus persica]